jgi:hypothetical protein
MSPMPMIPMTKFSMPFGVRGGDAIFVDLGAELTDTSKHQYASHPLEGN